MHERAVLFCMRTEVHTSKGDNTVRRNPTKLQELEAEIEQLEETLESINDVAVDADDAALSREQIVEKLREIAELSEADEGEEVAEAPSGD
jgi:hypothetical protein